MKRLLIFFACSIIALVLAVPRRAGAQEFSVGAYGSIDYEAVRTVNADGTKQTENGFSIPTLDICSTISGLKASSGLPGCESNRSSTACRATSGVSGGAKWHTGRTGCRDRKQALAYPSHNKVALTAWTHHALCPRFDEAAFKAFRDAYRGKGPERFPVSSLMPGT